MATLQVTFDARQLVDIDEDLAEIDDAINRGSVRAVNEVVDRTYDTARKRMNAGINLDDQYISRKLTVNHATAQPRATIVAAGDLTILGRYNPKILLKPVKHPGRSKGDASRGIAPGLKAAGVSVEVTRGSSKPIDNGFLMPLRSSNGMGVFTRGADDKVRHRYGPSVYQLFRTTVELIEPEIAADLEETATAAIQIEVRKAIQ